MKVKFFETLVPAGFPSQAEDYIEQALDLNEWIVEHPAATFFIRVEGDSMEGACIASGALLVVDRSLHAKDGDIVVALLRGEFLVKRLEKGSRIRLLAENPKYPPIEVAEGDEFQIWGVVTHAIHRTR